MSSRADVAVGDVEHGLDVLQRAEHAGVEHVADLLRVRVVPPVERLHHDDVG